ncbi:MAG TPA: ATP-binding cassette domain-containing protein [Jiangellaceae bacterium]|nr:ATP-binding cassette domain-containing protein [Jiangellaceae bacterium]
MPEETPALVIDDLYKSYGAVHAVKGLSVTVRPSTVLGLLGSNGAGKTTTVRIISTLVPYDRGVVRVLGRDVRREAPAVRARIGLTGQYSALDENLTAYENLEMIARLCHVGVRAARRRATELLETFDLTGAAKRLVKTYSGGMRRRLDLAASLVANAPLLILDEPTTGLDPRSRQNVWRLIRDMVTSGTTVLLTTQYLEEADELADDIVVMDSGTATAQGAPEVLKARVGGTRIEVHLTEDSHASTAIGALERFSTATAHIDEQSRIVTLPVIKEPRLLPTVVRTLDDLAIGIQDVRLREPTLDEVFLTLTGANALADEPSTA